VYLLSGDGAFVTDGSQVHPLFEDKVRDEYIENLAEDARGSFVALNPLNREVLFCPVTSGEFPVFAYVLDVDSGEIGKRSFPNGIGHALHGFSSQTVDDSWDGGSATSWDGGPAISWDTRSASPQTQLLQWTEPLAVGGQTYWADLNADSRVGRLVREGIQPDGDGVFLANRIWLDGEIPASGLTVSLASRYNDTDLYAGGGTTQYTQAGRWISLAAKGRDFRVEISGNEQFSIQRIGLELADTQAKF
ncbi:unnamed protein product, partial [marine sediment metagenome]